jgi:general secretion pathway protein G
MNKPTELFDDMKNKYKSSLGFTLIELLVVITIISFLSTIVIASIDSARTRGKVAKVASDLKQLNIVFNLYLNTNGVYPCFDHTWDDAKERIWSAPFIPTWPTLPWGEQYHWEHGLFTTFSISMNAPGQTTAETLDKFMDDGNLATGIIRGNANRLEYSGMSQSAAFIDCHI